MQKFSPIIEIICVSNLSKPRHSGPQKYQIRGAYRAKTPHKASFFIKKHFGLEESLFGVYAYCAKGSLQRPPDAHFPLIIEICTFS